MHPELMEATRLTRAGRLAEATALIQRTLGGSHFPDVASSGTPTENEPIETTFRVVNDSEPTTEAAGPTASVAAEQPTSWVSRARSRPPFATSFPIPADGFTLPVDLPGFPVRRPRSAGSPPLAGRWLDGSYSNASGTRAYKLYVPSGDRGRCKSLVIMLHGCTQNPDDFAAGTGMNVRAEADGFLVAYPAQVANANSSKCWNWFKAADQKRSKGEPSLIAGITRQVVAEYQVDPGRIYVAGLSAGGAMAAIMAATYPDLYAAVGVHSGLAPGCARDLPSAFEAMRTGGQPGRSGAKRAIPLILFHGDRDPTVHPDNAGRIIRLWSAMAGLEAGGRSTAPSRVEQGRSADGKAYTRTIHPDARGRTLVEEWTIHGAGHAWSGGSLEGSFTDPDGPDATRELVRFFREQTAGTGVSPPSG
jgi:poly(hydroxyalkanoate) depolymerase family esterase